MTARTGHLLAGRWQRVRCLAAAAGYVSGVDDLDPQFKKLVTERVAAGNPERDDSPTYLPKRLKQLEHETGAKRFEQRAQAAGGLRIQQVRPTARLPAPQRACLSRRPLLGEDGRAGRARKKPNRATTCLQLSTRVAGARRRPSQEHGAARRRRLRTCDRCGVFSLWIGHCTAQRGVVRQASSWRGGVEGGCAGGCAVSSQWHTWLASSQRSSSARSGKRCGSCCIM
jgi:hypothetical protein